jgi:dTMP kinase
MQAGLDTGFPGKLFIVEGIDGSGKSTQLDLLYKWLIAEGYCVFFSAWNSSPLVKKTTKLGKETRTLSPTTFSLIHATDFADRTEREIIPPLKAGAVVLADRYVYTAFARDSVRGNDREWIRKVYGFAVPPTIGFYFRVPLETALERILAGRPELKYYEAGLDMGWSDDPYESFRIFQGKILEEYEQLVKEYNLTVIDATLPITEQQYIVRSLVKPHLKNVLRDPQFHRRRRWLTDWLSVRQAGK